MDEKAEVTLEVNPTPEETRKLIEFKAAGVNRVSIGVQVGYCTHMWFVLTRQFSTTSNRQRCQNGFHEIGMILRCCTGIDISRVLVIRQLYTVLFMVCSTL